MSLELRNRLKSLVWRVGMMVLAFLVDWAIQNLSTFKLGTSEVILAGLVLGEVSKFLNKTLSEAKN